MMRLPARPGHSRQLFAFRAVQAAVEGQPAEALGVCESIGRGELAPLPAMILAWAHTIALGDIGNPLQAAAGAEEAAPLAAASPQTAYSQAVILIVFDTRR